MASIKFSLSSVGEDRAEIMMRCRITANKGFRVKTGLKGFRDYWSDKKNSHDTKKFINPLFENEVSDINEKLASLAASIKSKVDLMDNPEELSKELLKEAVDRIVRPEKFAPKQEAPKTLLQAIDHFINEIAPKKILRATGKPMGETTIKQHKQTLGVVKSYLEHINTTDIKVEDVNEDFYNNMVTYMYKRGYKLNTVGKHTKNIKAVINSLPLTQRVKCEFVERNKCVTLSEDVDNIYLNEEELKRVADVELDASHLDKVRDQFLLMAWTGCRYSDLHKLDKKHLTSDLKYFRIVQQKTGTKVTIPVLPETRRILEKYNYIVPKEITNQKFNEYLKEVALLAGLVDDVTITTTELADAAKKKADKVEHHYKQWEVVTAHTARRSFATNMYKRNFPTLMIMKITGHKTEKAFLKYIKVDEDENAERMLELFEAQMKNQLINL